MDASPQGHVDLIPRSDLSFELVDDDLLILDKRNKKIHRLNATARAMWDCLAENGRPESIAIRIAGAYGIPVDKAFPDVLQLIETIDALGLLETPSKNR